MRLDTPDALFLPFSTKRKMTPRRGEVWLFDLGMTAKIRPVLVVSVPFGDDDRVMVTVVPHTTELRGSQFEVSVTAPFLKPGAFLVQGISTYPAAWAIKKLGALSDEKFGLVFAALLTWIGHDTNREG